MKSASLLHLALSRRDSAMRSLVDRLRASDGARWFRGAAHSAPGLFSIESLLRGESVTLAQIRDLKSTAKALIAGGSTPDEILRGRLVYILSVAAALAHHRVYVSELPREEMLDLFGELASSLPAPWDELVGLADLRLEAELK
ncbi:MAG: hypothetical protein SFY69_13380 [Planctomycetota bacterium]|nr:hypothetical protein [Planctomycetota bacterium]